MVSEYSPLGLTRELIRFDTINPPGNEEACAHHLGRLLEAARFDCAYHAFAAGRTSLVARRGGDQGRPLCLTGHLDTVPLGATEWRTDPLAAEMDGGRLYGRGASDMKSGVAAMVMAAIRAGGALERGPGVVLVLTAGEETGAEGAIHLAHCAGALGAAGAIVVGEPTANAPYLGHKGVLWLHASARGVSAHGSMPEHGVNAAYKAGHMLVKLEQFDFNLPPHEILGKPTLNVGTVSGGMSINSVPDHAEIAVDIRTVPGVDHARVREALQSYLAPDLHELAASVDLQGVWTDPEDPWVQEVFEVMSAVLGEHPQPAAATYFTDASVLSRAYGGPPTIILGPGEPALAHQTDEYCEVARIEQAAEAYHELIMRWQARARAGG